MKYRLFCDLTQRIRGVGGECLCEATGEIKRELKSDGKRAETMRWGFGCSECVKKERGGYAVRWLLRLDSQVDCI